MIMSSKLRVMMKMIMTRVNNNPRIPRTTPKVTPTLPQCLPSLSHLLRWRSFSVNFSLTSLLAFICGSIILVRNTLKSMLSSSIGRMSRTVDSGTWSITCIMLTSSNNGLPLHPIGGLVALWALLMHYEYAHLPCICIVLSFVGDNDKFWHGGVSPSLVNSRCI